MKPRELWGAGPAAVRTHQAKSKTCKGMDVFDSASPWNISRTFSVVA